MRVPMDEWYPMSCGCKVRWNRGEGGMEFVKCATCQAASDLLKACEPVAEHGFNYMSTVLGQDPTETKKALREWMSRGMCEFHISSTEMLAVCDAVLKARGISDDTQ